MDKINHERITKDYQLKFTYEDLFDLTNDFLVDQFSVVDVPDKITARVLYESVADEDLTLDQHWNHIDHSVPFAQYLKYGFDAVRGKFDTCREFYMVFGGNYPGLSYKQGIANHLHFKRPGRDICRTVTALIPIDVSEPIAENLTFQWTDLPFPELEDRVWEKVSDNTTRREYTKAFFKSIRAAKNNPVEKVMLPNQDEILVIDFNSYNYLHSVNDFTSNTYLICIFDDCV